MIARLRGKPVGRTADGLVLDVNGVGYLVAASSAALRKAEGAAEITVETYLHVREDALQLYGFADAGRARALRPAALRQRRRPEGRARDRLGLARRRAAARDRARGHGPLRRHPGDRQEDGGADRARAEGEGRPRRAVPVTARGCGDFVARDALSSSGTRSSTPSGRSRRSIRICRPRTGSVSRSGGRHERVRVSSSPSIRTESTTLDGSLRPQTPRGVRRPGARAGAARDRARRRRARAASRSTTSCSSARPGSARRRSR